MKHRSSLTHGVIAAALGLSSAACGEAARDNIVTPGIPDRPDVGSDVPAIDARFETDATTAFDVASEDSASPDPAPDSGGDAAKHDVNVSDSDPIIPPMPAP